MTDISLRDTILPPGIIRCHKTNECTGFVWDNVHATGFGGWWEFLGLGFITEHAHGVVTNSSPNPHLDGKIHNFELGEFAKKFLKKEAIKIIEKLACERFKWLPCDEFTA